MTALRWGVASSCALAFGLFAPEASATAYFIRAETQAQAYQIRSYRQTDPLSPVLLPRRRLVQYLGIDVFEIVTGEDFGFESDVRIAAELGLPRRDAELIDGLRNEDVDLLNASLKYARGGWEGQLGRQVYVDVMDMMAFDGLRVRYVSPLGIGAEVFAGFWVKGAGFLGSSVYQPDGTRESDVRRLADGIPLAEEALDDLEPVVGAKLLAMNLAGLSGALGYKRAMVAGKLDLERATFELRYGNRQGLNAFGGIDYDLFLQRLAQARVEARYDAPRFATSAEYVRFSPVFSSDSIWAYFAYAARDEVRLTGEWSPAGPLRFHLRAIGSHYNQNVNPDLAISIAVTDPGGHSPYSIGGSAGAQATFGSVRLSANAVYRTGFGGEQLWTDLTGGWFPKQSPITVQGRVSVVDVADQLNPLLRGTFFGVQAWGSYAFSEQAKASVVLEENVNPFTRSDFKVFLLFDFKAAIG